MAQGKKTGGRQKGTPNKATKKVRDAISDVVNNYFNSDKFEKDIEKLDAKDRVSAIEKLASYVIPKLQSVNLEADAKVDMTLSNKLAEMAEEEE